MVSGHSIVSYLLYVQVCLIGYHLFHSFCIVLYFLSVCSFMKLWGEKQFVVVHLHEMTRECINEAQGFIKYIDDIFLNARIYVFTRKVLLFSKQSSALFLQFMAMRNTLLILEIQTADCVMHSFVKPMCFLIIIIFSLRVVLLFFFIYSPIPRHTVNLNLA